MPDFPPSLEVNGLRQRYGRNLALDALDFGVEAGTVLAVMGQNGSGKSTLLRVLAGIERPVAGLVRVGRELAPWERRELRRKIGYLPQSPALSANSTVRAQLLAAARLRDRGASAVERQIERCQLTDLTGRRIGALSAGQRQRVALALCLLCEPSLLLLDEPTAALDPDRQALLTTLVRDLRGTATVVMTTHHVHEATALADAVLVLSQGRAAGFVHLDQWQDRIVVQLASAEPLPDLPGISATRQLGPSRHELRLAEGADLALAASRLSSAGVPLASISAGRSAAESHLLRLIAEGRP